MDKIEIEIEIENETPLSVSDQYKAQGFSVSDHEADLLDRGFKGNGCGSSLLSRVLCLVMQLFFKVDFSIAWLIHDSGYSESRSTKHRDKKADSDKNLQLNFLTCIGKEPTKRQLQIARALHVIVMFGGDKSYWKA